MRHITANVVLLGGMFLGLPLGYARESVDEPTIDLQEVVVHGGRTIEKGDHVILFLSKENEKFGTSSLDAISSLNRFQIAVNAKKLTSYNGKDVFILINGVPSDANELYSIKSEDIKQVLYYDEPPAKYRGLTTNPIANIILRKKRAYSVNGYIRTENSVYKPFNTENVGVTYRDSLNMVGVNYDFDFLDQHDIDSETIYKYADGSQTNENGRDNTLISNLHKVRGVYQRYEGNQLFNATARYNHNSDRSFSPYSLVSSDNGIDSAPEAGGRDVKKRYDALGLDLYYHIDFSNRQRIVIDLAGGYTDSKLANRVYRSGSGNDTENEALMSGGYNPFDIESLDKNKVYTISAFASYSRPLWSGEFSATARHDYKRLDRNMLTGNSHSEQNLTSIFASMSWYKSFWYLSPMIGVLVNDDKYDVRHDTSVVPSAHLTGRIYGWGKLSNFSATLRGYVTKIQPGIANTDNSMIYLDKNYVSAGNPDLKSNLLQETSLQLQYFTPDGRNYVWMQLANQHFFDYVGPVLFFKDGMAWKQNQNIDDCNFLTFSATFRYSPAPWVFISPHFTLTNSHYNTPANRIRKTTATVGGSVIFNFWKCNISLAAEAPQRNYNGDFYTKSNGLVYSQIMFYHKSLSAGITYAHNWATTNKGICPGFEYYNREVNHSYEHSVILTLNWSFSYGKSRKHDQKTVNNSTFESGLRN